MRFSVFKDDEGYENYIAHRPIMVYLDDNPLSHVVRADTSEGWVEFNVIGEDGLFVIENSEIVTDVSYGLVEVTGVGLPVEPEVTPPDPEVEPEPMPEPEPLPEGESNG